MVWGVRQVGPRPARPRRALAGWRVAAGANGGARAGGWEDRRGFAKPDRSKAVAGSVFGWPARRALLARGVDGLLAFVAET